MLHVPEFLAAGLPVIDVRSPAEFRQGHIPGAFSVPLFTDEERAIVGTLYKQKGKEPAIEKGLELVGTKLLSFVQLGKALAKDKKVLVHCWRGGMRSSSFAWLLQTAGLSVDTLRGGYKYYRRLVLESLQHCSHTFVVLGGHTGSGKTELLHLLQSRGEQVIDLEGLANHRGSAFGSLGEQPTNEQFENDLHHHLSRLDLHKITWIEAESRKVGKVILPQGLWNRMSQSRRINVELPLPERVQRLVTDYAGHDPSFLKESVLKIEKRLGSQYTREALLAIDNQQFDRCAEICLSYYDKCYAQDIQHWNPQQVKTLPITTDFIKNTQQLITTAYAWTTFDLPNTATEPVVAAK